MSVRSIPRRSVLTGFAATLLCGSPAHADVMLLNVSYDPTRELYKAINAEFKQSMDALTHQRDEAFNKALADTKAMLTREQWAKWEAMHQRRGPDRGPG